MTTTKHKLAERITGVTFIGAHPLIWGKPCIKDENFEGSLYEKLGLSQWICPHCTAHVSEEITCLNGCHLNGGSLRKFMREL